MVEPVEQGVEVVAGVGPVEGRRGGEARVQAGRSEDAAGSRCLSRQLRAPVSISRGPRVHRTHPPSATIDANRRCGKSFHAATTAAAMVTITPPTPECPRAVP